MGCKVRLSFIAYRCFTCGITCHLQVQSTLLRQPGAFRLTTLHRLKSLEKSMTSTVPAKRKRRGKSTLVTAEDYPLEEIYTEVQTSRGTKIKSSTVANVAHVATPRRTPVASSSHTIQQPQVIPEDTNQIVEEIEMRQTSQKQSGKVVKPFLVHCSQSNTFQQSQNDFLREFLTHRNAINDRILANEGITQDTKCDACGKVDAKWKCRDCLPAVWCKDCCRETHRVSPFHRLMHWTGTHFQRAQLSQTGLKIYLRHRGSPCPCIQPSTTESPTTQSDIPDTNDVADNLFPEELDLSEDIGRSNDPNEDEDDWEDEDEDRPRHSKLQDDEIVVVDVMGVFVLQLVSCLCDRPDKSAFMDLIDLALFPASFLNPKTAFTFNVLRDYRLSNLEMHVSAYQYFQKLRRCTNSAFPHKALTRYQELRRVSRQWRNLLHRRWHGIGFRLDPLTGNLLEPKPGTLSLFCATCPQPGINLPKDWKEQYSL